MIHYIEADSQGKIFNFGSAGGFSDAESFKKVLPTAIILDTPVSQLNQYYWDGKAIQPMGRQPSLAHEFNYELKAWVLNAQTQWELVKSKRNDLLAATDWRVIKAQEEGISLDPVWIAYRQALRDITEQPDPFKIVWPNSPN